MILNIPIITEACVENLEQAICAEKNGATQIELCSDLSNDGLSPDFLLIKTVIEKLKIPVKVMVRCRSGNFVYSNAEMGSMLEYITNIKNEFAIAGFVFGASYSNHFLNTDLINTIAAHAYPYPLTVHKAIDQSPDIISDIIKLIKIDNVDSILSSGGADCALHGIPNLLKMNSLLPQNKYIIAAGSITKHNLQELHDKLQLKAYHGRKIV